MDELYNKFHTVTDPENLTRGVDREVFSYRMKFPKQYRGTGDSKFEKNLNFGGVGRTNIMTYKFVNVFPLSINSMPVSYDHRDY